MRSKALLVLTAIGLAGCAVAPQQAVTQLNTSSPKYNTQECQQARQIAMSYDDNTAGRMGLGLGLGLLLGPLGIPFAMMADGSQNSKREAVLEELKKHCEGNVVATSTNNASDTERRLAILNDLKAKGLLSESEYSEKKSKLVDEALAVSRPSTNGSVDSASIVGVRFGLRDLDPTNRRQIGENFLTVDSVTETGISINGSSTQLDQSGRIVRGTIPLPFIAAIGGSRLREGTSHRAKLFPAGGMSSVDINVRVISLETIQIAGKNVTVARCKVEGNASAEHAPGIAFQSLGAPISGEALIEPITGLIVSAKVQSAHHFYSLLREPVL